MRECPDYRRLSDPVNTAVTVSQTRCLHLWMPVTLVRGGKNRRIAGGG